MARTEIEIIYEDEDVRVVNKPCGILVTHDRAAEPDVQTVLYRQQRDIQAAIQMLTMYNPQAENASPDTRIFLDSLSGDGLETFLPQ